MRFRFPSKTWGQARAASPVPLIPAQAESCSGEYRLKHIIFMVASMGLSCLTAAAEFVPYDRLVRDAMGVSTPASYIGKQVRVAASNKGELGYFVRKEDAVTFVCKSGDTDLRALRVRAPVFQGTVIGFEGWEGATVFSLKNCAVAKDEGPSRSTGPSAAGVLYQHPGTRDVPEKLRNPAHGKVVGQVDRVKDPGGWVFVLRTAGRKEIRLAYEGADDLSKALGQLALSDNTVQVAGVMGSFPGGWVAFDTTKPLTISRP